MKPYRRCPPGRELDGEPEAGAPQRTTLRILTTEWARALRGTSLWRVVPNGTALDPESSGGEMRIVDLHVPSLRRLCIVRPWEWGAPPSIPTDALRDAPWPNLEELELRFGFNPQA